MNRLPSPVTARLPAPGTTPPIGHLWRWTFRPVELLTEGARIAAVFQLSLWRRVVVGYRPDWNRAVLGDLETFRSRGSLSDLTPYLSAGVVHADVPDHHARRAALNPTFHARALDRLTEQCQKVATQERPHGTVEALEWAATVVRRMLNATFFDGALDDELLARFLAPLHRPTPAPLLPRPLLFRRTDAAIRRALADPPPGSLVASLATMDNAAEEIRVALAAGYDTTAHTLAWALWHLAGSPQWREPDAVPLVLDEILRLYPAGWIGSRIVRRDTEIAGVPLRAGTMVLYSPYLTHRDPELWPDPAAFRPDRFIAGRPAWGFIPFSAGRRTCLGSGLARLMLRTALEPLARQWLRQVSGDEAVTTSLTLRPAGPLLVELR